MILHPTYSLAKLKPKTFYQLSEFQISPFSAVADNAFNALITLKTNNNQNVFYVKYTASYLKPPAQYSLTKRHEIALCF